jgi:heme exporter protein D
MNWNSVGDFFAMGGYGLYVWGAYGVVFAWLLAEPMFVARRHAQALAKVLRLEKEEY